MKSKHKGEKMAYTEKQLEKYSIYQLRYLARSLGVRSPTTKKRAELLQKIVAIQEGREMPYVPLNSKGRPAKSCFLPLEADGVLVYGLDNQDIGEDIVFSKQLGKYNSDKTEKVEGYVLENKQQNFLIEFEEPTGVNRIAYLSKELIGRLNIREGSKLVCEAKYNTEVEMYVVTNINKVDGKKFEGVAPTVFERIPIKYSKEKMELEGESEFIKTVEEKAPLYFGDKSLIVGNKRTRLDSILLPLTRALPEKAKIIFVAMNEKTQVVEKLRKESDDKFELFATLFGDSANVQYTTLKIGINRAKRLAETNKNVVLIISDIDEMYVENVGQETMCSIKSFFAMARNFAEKGSFTVIGCCSPDFYEKHKSFEYFMNGLYIEKDDKLYKDETIRQDD